MKVGITFSTFDLLHAGHVKMLEEAKRQCDYLIVGLQLDPSIDRPEKNGPSQSIIERYIQLKGSKHINEIVPLAKQLGAKRTIARISNPEFINHKDEVGFTKFGIDELISP